MNDRYESDLVEAEKAKTLAQYITEIDRLDRAIQDAQVSKSLTAEALANEQIAQIYIKWGKEKIAAVYIQAAYDCYTRSGATTKTEKLALHYPQLLEPILPQRQKFGGKNYFTDEFIATLSHEFRNPLNGILGMSEALLEEVFGTMNEQQLNAVATIDRSGSYLLALINNMTDLSLIQANKLELEITPVSVAELCQFSSNFVKHHAIQKQIQLETDVPPHAGDISIDLKRMRQVLINLLNRAIDSTPLGGKVRLVVTRERDFTISTAPLSIQFSIVDTSREIPPANEDRSPQSPFPTGSANDSRRIGLSLMLIHPIVELHGGTIGFSPMGRGNCVKISLPNTCLTSNSPIDSFSERLRQPNNPTADLASPIISIVEEIPKIPLILIVEDNELNINTISSYLTAKGYHPILASDGKSAISILEELANEPAQKNLPDLILMDIQMPGMDGFEAITRIRQNPQLVKIPIIALTALAMEGDREKCLNAGANDYLTKPVKLKQLNTTIQQFLVAKNGE